MGIWPYKSAVPTFFKRICIGYLVLSEEFVNTSIEYNNPVWHLIKEAQQEFGLRRAVSYIVSIGIGKLKVAGFKARMIL